MLRYLNKTLPTLLCLLLASCASGPDKAQKEAKPVISLGQATLSPEEYIALSNQSVSADNRINYRLLACESMLKQDANQANLCLDNVASDSLNHLQIQKLRFIKAHIARANGQLDTAMALANQVDKRVSYVNALYLLKADIYRDLSRPYDEAYQLTLIDDATQKEALNLRIWSSLQLLPAATLSMFQSELGDPVINGWLQLAYLMQTYIDEPTQLVSKVKQWKQINPQHPAALNPPADIQTAIDVEPFKPQKVAVLLPLSGRYAPQAKALRDGMLANLYQQGVGTSLIFIDSEQGILPAYEKALTNRAEFVIGPLLPNNVDKLLSEVRLTIPQLMLNSPQNPLDDEKLFYYSLSSTVEATNAANYLHTSGSRRPIIIHSAHPSAKRMAQAFSQQWRELNRESVDAYSFNSMSTLKQSVQQAMDVSNSLERIKRLTQLLDQSLETEFRSRQDIDSIYIIANNSELKLIKPFIDVNLSIFSTPPKVLSASRGAVAGNNIVPELNGLYINDMPWVLSDSEEKMAFNALLGNNNISQQRFFSMGYDAIDLIGRLAQMRVFNSYQLIGKSGSLTSDKSGAISPTLPVGKVSQGKIVIHE